MDSLNCLLWLSAFATLQLGVDIRLVPLSALCGARFKGPRRLFITLEASWLWCCARERNRFLVMLMRTRRCLYGERDLRTLHADLFLCTLVYCRSFSTVQCWGSFVFLTFVAEYFLLSRDRPAFPECLRPIIIPVVQGPSILSGDFLGASIYLFTQFYIRAPASHVFVCPESSTRKIVSLARRSPWPRCKRAALCRMVELGM